MTNAPSPDGIAPGELAIALRGLLGLDRSLTRSDRRVLERLLLVPGPSTVRELASSTGLNVQSLYLSVARLERRGLLIQEGRSGGMTYRSGHPTAVLHELLGEWRRADELAHRIEDPLRQIHEGPPSGTPEANRLWSTGSLTAMLGTILHQLRAVRSEVWVVGHEEPWCTASTAVLHGLVRLSSRLPRLEVRILVDGRRSSPERRASWERLRGAGLPLRTSSVFATSMMVLDRRWIGVAEAARAEPGGSPPRYFAFESPDLGEDIARACTSAWSRARDPLEDTAGEDAPVGAERPLAVEL